jgi:NADPH:quinone reductase-like Zn-dependent oxidoreductase
MKAMVLERLAGIEADPTPLRLVDLPEPEPRDGEVLVRGGAACHQRHP